MHAGASMIGCSIDLLGHPCAPSPARSERRVGQASQRGARSGVPASSGTKERGRRLSSHGGLVVVVGGSTGYDWMETRPLRTIICAAESGIQLPESDIHLSSKLHFGGPFLCALGQRSVWDRRGVPGDPRGAPLARTARPERRQPFLLRGGCSRRGPGQAVHDSQIVGAPAGDPRRAPGDPRRAAWGRRGAPLRP